MKLNKQLQNAIEELLQETGFELWNADCTLRLGCNAAREKRFAVCTYDNPMHAIKEYNDINRAIKFMEEN